MGKNKLTNIILTVFLLFISNLSYGQNEFELNKTRELIITGISSSLLITSLYLEHKQLQITLKEIENLNPNKLNSLDRRATQYFSEDLSSVSDYLLYTSISLPILFSFIPKTQKELNELGIMYLETLTLTYGLTNLTKNLTHRYRPYVYNKDIPIVKKLDSDSRKSFFSGHTSFAFASSIFFAKIISQYSISKQTKNLIWAGSISLATSVGLLRYFSGYHFPSDIFAGAIVGGFIGYFIPEIHKTNNLYLYPMSDSEEVVLLFRLLLN